LVSCFFSALNKVEWTLALLISIVLLINLEHHSYSILGIVVLPLSLLMFQTTYLLPKLKGIAKDKIEGINSPKYTIHIYYIILELIKVVILACLGYMLFKI
jgi:hypothetical protein